MVEIGSRALDEKIYLNTLDTELMTDEELRAEIEAIEAEEGEIEIPTLQADKYTPSDFIINGKLHPRFDEIWDYIQKGTNETPEEIMAKF